jgi:hypothetical protein
MMKVLAEPYMCGKSYRVPWTAITASHGIEGRRPKAAFVAEKQAIVRPSLRMYPSPRHGATGRLKSIIAVSLSISILCAMVSADPGERGLLRVHANVKEDAFPSIQVEPLIRGR